MTYSMTAFARRDRDTEWGNLGWELRAVNHRYLELSLKLPEELRHLEPMVREAVGKRVARGKLDCNLRFKPREGGAELKIDPATLDQLRQLNQQILASVPNAAPMRVADYLRWPGVLVTPPMNLEQLTQEALSGLNDALADLSAMREREGARLQTLIEQRLDAVATTVRELKTVIPEIVPAFRARLSARVAELQGLDSQRLEQEVVLFAQRIDVAEEVDRLGAHLDEVRNIFRQQGQIGRRLDFVMQEFNREANTLASKSSDLRLTKAATELKVLIEQMREQVQNIE